MQELAHLLDGGAMLFHHGSPAHAGAVPPRCTTAGWVYLKKELVQIHASLWQVHLEIFPCRMNLHNRPPCRHRILGRAFHPGNRATRVCGTEEPALQAAASEAAGKWSKDSPT